MNRSTVVALLLLMIASTAPAAEPDPPLVHTFSIVALDPETGELGVAVQSKFFSVGSVVPWASAGVGAIATQAICNVRYGTEGLELLAGGKTPATALKTMTGQDSDASHRQVAIIDAAGVVAVHTGDDCHAWAGHRTGVNYAVQGNLLAGEAVVDAMAKAFESSRAAEGTRLADWLMAALQAGQDAGGDKRGQQSAALLVVREGGGFLGGNDRFIDLRVEDHETPIVELARLLDLHKAFFAPAHRRKASKR